MNLKKILTETDLAISREKLRVGGEPACTILTSLQLASWTDLVNAWHRGKSWVVWKDHNRWRVHGLIPGEPTFDKQSDAYDFVTNLIRAESYRRLWEATRA